MAHELMHPEWCVSMENDNSLAITLANLEMREGFCTQLFYLIVHFIPFLLSSSKEQK